MHPGLPHQARWRFKRVANRFLKLYTRGSQEGKGEKRDERRRTNHHDNASRMIRGNRVSRMQSVAGPGYNGPASPNPKSMTVAPVSIPKTEVHCAQCGGVLNPDEGQVVLT